MLLCLACSMEYSCGTCARRVSCGLLAKIKFSKDSSHSKEGLNWGAIAHCNGLDTELQESLDRNDIWRFQQQGN